SAPRLPPAAAAASSAAAKPSTRSGEAATTVAGADDSTTRANGREKSVGVNGSTVTPSWAPSTISHVPSAGNSSTAPAAAPQNHGAVPDAVDAARSKWMSGAPHPGKATPAKRPAETSASNCAGSEITRVASAVVATGPGTSALAA